MEILARSSVKAKKEKSLQDRVRKKSEQIQPDASSPADVASKPRRGLARSTRRKRWERVCGRVLMCKVFLSASLEKTSDEHERISRFTVCVSNS